MTATADAAGGSWNGPRKMAGSSKEGSKRAGSRRAGSMCDGGSASSQVKLKSTAAEAGGCDNSSDRGNNGGDWCNRLDDDGGGRGRRTHGGKVSGKGGGASGIR